MMNKVSLRTLLTLPLLIALLISFAVGLGLGSAHAASSLSVVITSPRSNSIIGTRNYLVVDASVTDTATNATITKVEFYITTSGGSTTLMGTATTAPYSVTWLIPASDGGTDSLTAKAYDSLGNVATSSPVSILVPVSDPIPGEKVTLTSPANGSTFTFPATITLTATITPPANPVAQVAFYSGGTTLLGTSPGSPSMGPYSITWSPTVAGTYSLTAVLTDTFGITSTSPAVTITVTGSTGNDCKVTYVVSSQWPGGFTANITLQNTSTTTIPGWILMFTFPGNQKITNLWNATYTQSGEQVSITSSAAWNSTIPPNGTVSIGFNATYSGTNSSPTSFTLNGHPCSS